ncbi:MAG: lysoplasmalogenase [Pseudomonadales bacterium]
MPNNRIIFLLCFCLLAALYIAIEPTTVNPAKAILKILPLLMLIVWVARSHFPDRTLLLAALIFGGGGDTFLAYGQFIPGLASFLIGHLFYTGLWCRGPLLKKPLYALPALGLTALCLAFLLPHTGELSLYIGIYILVIGLMATAASVSRLAIGWGVIGAYSFLFSDFLIGWNRFIEPFWWARVGIMLSYYAAQLFITYSVLHFFSNQRNTLANGK